jgi:hypothetical protein
LNIKLRNYARHLAATAPAPFTPRSVVAMHKSHGRCYVLRTDATPRLVPGKRGCGL